MLSLTKKVIRKIYKFFGYKVSEKPKTKKMSFLEGALFSLHAKNKGTNRKIKIVQIGANNGVDSDPLNNFIHTVHDDISLMLIEPQEHCIPELKKEYDDVDDLKIVNKAVGPESELLLYQIRPEFWDQWTGLIATGITSFNRNFVLNKARTMLPEGQIPAEEKIRELRVPCIPLLNILEDESFGTDIDVLQVDCEGYDGKVLLSSEVETVRPDIINYEFNNMTEADLAETHNLLQNSNYHVLRWCVSDECALKME